MSLPPLPPSFRWTSESWGAALRCVPLEAVAPHLFSTRQLPLTSEAHWEALRRAVGVERLVQLTQVHGRAVIVHRREAPLAEGERPEADVVVSNDPRLGLVVRAADCVPLLLADPRTGAVAAVHAGWRGTAAGAAAAAVEALAAEFGASPADLVAALGPSIGPCCYEVGTELVDAFAAAGHPRHLVDRWFLAPPLRRGAFGGRIGGGPKLRLDTWTANRDQLVLAGVPEDRIHVSELCTACHQALFPSYRVEGMAAGRMGAIITASRDRRC